MSEIYLLGKPNSDESLANSREMYRAAIGALLGPRAVSDGELYVVDKTAEGVRFKAGVYPSGYLEAMPRTEAEERWILERGIGWLSFGDVERQGTGNAGNPTYYALKPGEVSVHGVYILGKINEWLGYQAPAMEPIFYSPTQPTIVPDPFKVPYLSDIYQRLVELPSES